MSYIPTTPAGPGEALSQSQPKITNNFEELDTFLTVNHESLNDPDQGKHKFMQMPNQSGAPLTVATEGALYTKLVGGVSEGFYSADGGARESVFTSVKAWVLFNGTNGAITTSMNVSTVVRNSTGRYTITLLPAFPNSNYLVLITTGASGNDTVSGCVDVKTTSTTTVFVNRVNAVGTTTSAPFDAGSVSVVFLS